MNKGLAWLGNRSWSEITRDERFFCAHLYRKVLEHQDGIPGFVKVINECRQEELPLDANWELGYEVCFYRDLWFDNPDTYEMLSPKRTFDLALFSDEFIVIIEAKAYQSFDSEQTKSFKKDEEYILKELALPVKVVLVPLASSLYEEIFDANTKIKETFDCNLLTWKELAKTYGNDEILTRADLSFGLRPKSSVKGKQYLTGRELQQLSADNQVDAATYWVGRQNGLPGLSSDLPHSIWVDRPYEVMAEASAVPNRNWFTLKEFVQVVSAKRPD